VYDVVQEWRRLTGLPAVLAVWAGRRESVTPEIVADFAASKAYGMAHLAEISTTASVEQDLPVPDLLNYLQENIDFTLDSENLAGLELYYCLAAKLGLIPTAKAIEWANLSAPRYASR
jgi:predicted solute-binding protein